MLHVYSMCETLDIKGSYNKLIQRVMIRTEMMREPFYPKVLICFLTRINKNDTINNNLLLRNLFASWPKDKLAQIYSGGSNGDDGFCGRQYHISPKDRRFGSLFFKWKGEYADASFTDFSAEPDSVSDQRPSRLGRLKHDVGRYIMNSGLYELVFKLHPSQQLVDWAKAFDPDIILAQGYNLSFTWLPLFLKRQLKKPLAFYCSDDWPSYLYASQEGLNSFTAPLMRQIVIRSTKQLFENVDVPLSFNRLMGDEYERRYNKPFITLMHGDDPQRFRQAAPIRVQPPEVKSIVATGGFDDTRWPLLLDLEEACQRLNQEGILVKATVLASRISEEGYRRVRLCQYVTIRDDPGHELLPSYLKGADLLYLPETFDPRVAFGYRYSISTKAHLFMFSHRPILVYGHPANGVVQYANQEGWATAISERGGEILWFALKTLLTDDRFSKQLVNQADDVAKLNHNMKCNQKTFLHALAAGRLQMKYSN